MTTGATNEGVEHPASPGQVRFWLLERLHPGCIAARVMLNRLCVGPLDLDALRLAWFDVVGRHEPLRTTFAERASGLVQVVRAAEHAPFDVELAVSANPASVDEHDAGDEIMFSWLATLRTRPFDLVEGPLARARVLVLGPDRYCLSIDMHHAVVDAASARPLISDLAIAYEGRLSGRADGLPALAESYGAWALRLRGAASNRELALTRTLARLDGAPTVLSLPTDRRRPAIEDPESGSTSAALGRELVDRLAELTRRIGVRRSVPYLAAMAVLVQRWSGQDTFLIGVPVSGRDDPAAAELVGYFVNTVVVRVDLTGDPSVAETMTRLQGALEEALAESAIPIDEVIAARRLPVDRSRHPLFQVMFNFTTLATSSSMIGGVELVRIPESFGSAICDLDVDVRRFLERDAEPIIRVTGKAALFDPATLERWAEQFVHLLHQLADHVEASTAGLSRLSLMTDAGAAAMTALYRGPALPVEAGLDVGDRLARMRSQHPAAPALVGPDGAAMTYAQLDALVARRAGQLRILGAGPGRIVGVQVDPPVEAIVTVLATWQTGAAYVPLPIDSEQRRRAIVDDARPIAIVAGSAIDSVAGSAASTARSTRPDLAAVIYTSGSTGVPKGVCVTQANLAASTAARLALYGDEPQTMILTYPLVFDASLSPLLWTLTTGGTLIVPPGQRRADPRLLGPLIEKHGVTTLDVLPGVWSGVLEHARPERLASLRMVVVGAERCPPSLVRHHFAALPECRLVNEYGPTEATVFATAHECRPDDADRPTVPIGRPIPGYRVSVLDGLGRPTPIGVPGELVIAGPGVTAGYLDRPELTQDRFRAEGSTGVADEPVGEATRDAAAMAYWSGDRARFLADGSIELLGRLDRQVKVLGHRIEPGEIEAALLDHPAVTAALVGLAPIGNVEERLVAHVECDRGLDRAALSSWLGSRLPTALVPATFVLHASLPRTASGKVDPAVLLTWLDPNEPAAPDLDGRPSSRTAVGAAVKAVTDTEQRISLMFAEVLGHTVGATDDFFAGGGSSMSSLRLFALIERDLGIDLPLATLFEAPTVASLARVVEDLGPREWSPLILLSRPAGTSTPSSAGAAGIEGPAAPPVVGPIEGSGPIVFVHGLGGNITGFANLARRLGVDHVCYALQSGGLDGRGIPYRSIDELAERGCTEIVRVVPRGPCVIAGLSFGGLAACEIAHRLAALGYQPQVLMLDGAAPGFQIRHRRRRGRLSESLRWIELRARLRAGQRIPIMRRRHYLFLAHDRLFDRHPVRTYDVPMTLLCTEHLPEVHLDRWKSIAAAGLHLHRLGGDHASFLEEPIVADTARAIAEAIAAAIDQPERCVRGLTTTGREPGSAEASVSKS